MPHFLEDLVHRGHEGSHLWLIIFSAVWVAICQWAGLTGDFLLDDYGSIVFNPSVHPAALDFSDLAPAWSSYGGPIGRPLATLSFALNFLANGLDPYGYKLVNLALHCANVILVSMLVRRLVALTDQDTATANFAGVLAALAWGVHPLQVSTVMYVVQRMEVMAAMGMTIALCLYIDARLRQIHEIGGFATRFIVSMAAVLIALLCKETAVLVPLLTLGIELFFLRFRDSRGRTMRGLVWFYVTGLAVSLMLFVVWVLPEAAAQYRFRSFTLSERLLTQLRVLPLYLGQITWPNPTRLPFYLDGFPLSRSLFSPASTWAGGLFLLALAVISIALHRRSPLTTFGIFLFFSCHTLTSNVLPLEIAFEHRNYLALLGPVLVATDIFIRLAARWTPRRILLLLLLPLALLSATTALRSLTWGNALAFAAGAVHEAPNSPRAAYDMGVRYLETSGGEEASIGYVLGMAEFKRATNMPAASPLPMQAMIIVNAKVGLIVPDAWWDNLMQKFRSRGFGPQEASAFYTLLSERDEGLPLPTARIDALCQLVVSKVPDLPEPHFRCGDFWLRTTGDTSRAQAQFDLALATTPSTRRSMLQARIEEALALESRLKAGGVGGAIAGPRR